MVVVCLAPRMRVRAPGARTVAARDRSRRRANPQDEQRQPPLRLTTAPSVTEHQSRRPLPETAPIGHNQSRRRGPDARARTKASLDRCVVAHLLFANRRCRRGPARVAFRCPGKPRRSRRRHRTRPLGRVPNDQCDRAPHFDARRQIGRKHKLWRELGGSARHRRFQTGPR